MIDYESETRVVLYSSRFLESREFYETVLELKVVSEWDHGAGQLGVVYRIGAAYLELLQSETHLASDSFYVYSKVRDVETLWSHLRNRAPVVKGIETQPWGHRNFSIRDPNGYVLKFYSENSQKV